jgi:formylglycine-generating enzyme required for sulfatase activity
VLELIVVGDTVAVRIDGVETARYTGVGPAFARGHIALQVRDPGTVVEFKKIEVKELPATPSAVPSPPPAVAPFDGAKAREHQEAWAKHLGVPAETTNSIGMKLRLIPPGEFLMGSAPDDHAKSLDELKKHGKSGWFFEFVESRSGPQRVVRLTKPYYLGAHEVTVEDFRRFVQATGYRTLAEKNAGKPYWEKPRWAVDMRHPVTFIAWDDANAFCDWLGRKDGRTYRLPTEAEWEFACRAGTTTRWSWGDDRDQFLRHAWFSRPIDGGLARVGEKMPNAFGLFDMHGNAEEWCADWHHSMLTIEPENPHRTEQKDATGRVVRGGFGFDIPELGRSGRRSFALPRDTAGIARGFRVVIVGDLAAKPPAAAPDPALVKSLRDVVSAKEKNLDAAKARFAAGAVPRQEVIAAEVEVVEARVKLAAEEGDKAAVAHHLAELVTLRKEERDLASLLVQLGREPIKSLNDADARLAEAKARLAKARAEAPPVVAPPPRERGM